MDNRLFRIAKSRVWTGIILCCSGWPLGSQTAPSKTPAASQATAPAQKDHSSKPTDNAPEMGEFTISAEVNLVLLDVSVRDADGGFVSGLSKEAFTILEDGRPQTITQFANQDVPVTMGLIVDNSGSMRPKKPEVVTAALVLIQASNPKDEVFVINFNDKVRRGLPDMVPFSDDPQALRKALRKTDPEGRTSLYDALITGLNHLDMGRRDKKTLVVVSDGGDNASTHNFKEVSQAALGSRATIYTVGVYSEDDPDKNPEILKKLARVSGGVCYLPKKLNDVEDICRQIAKDIRTRYTIGFVPQGLTKPGERHIKVEVHSPDHAKLIARTRTSYIVGQGQPAARKK